MNIIIAGDLTFFHSSGVRTFKPQEFDIEMGNLLKLPKDKMVKIS